MKKHLFYFSIAAITLSACKPSVYTDLYTYEYQPTTVDSVAVFIEGDEMPEKGLAIGTLKVELNGVSTGNFLMKSIEQARIKTAEVGGNGLIINNTPNPSRLSDLIPLKGTMLRFDNGVTDSLVAAGVERSKNYAQLQYGKLYTNYYDRLKQQPRNILKFSIGPTWMTSDVDVDGKIYKHESGYMVSAEYQHLWKRGIGAGINTVYSKTNLTGFTMKLYYIGPSIVFASMLGEKWRYDISYSIGFSTYNESDAYISADTRGVGMTANLGIEYMLSRRVGIGLQYGTYVMRLPEPTNYDKGKYDFYGVRQINLQCGLRFYL